MAKRMFLMLVVVGVLISVLGTVKFQQVQAAIAEGSSYQPPPDAVTTVSAEPTSWEQSLSAIGTVTAVNGVTLSADLPGIVESISFESGQAVAKGVVLVKLDSRQERAQLDAARAQLALTRLHLERVQGLRAKGVTSQSELDIAVAENSQAEAQVGEIEAAIERKAVRAPFAGRLGLRQVNLGQYLESGAPIVSLQALRPIYVDFDVPQQQRTHLALGTSVAVSADGLNASGQGSVDVIGKVSAVDSVVDAATRNVSVRATFDNADGLLQPGMFVEVEASVGAARSVVAIPASAVKYAPYGDSVFIVEEQTAPSGDAYLGVRQQFVELGEARGDQVAILSGVQPGEEVVSSGVFKLFNGGAVEVNNSVQPSNDPAPQPENS